MTSEHPVHGAHAGHGHGGPSRDRGTGAGAPHGGDHHHDDRGHGGHGRHVHDGHGHGHGGHGHGVEGATGNALGWALGLTAAFMVVEAVAGVLTHGLSLLADAAHMLADTAALALALAASRWARRPRTARTTFGHKRAEVLAAFLNGIALAVTALGIVTEAVERWQAPRDVHAGPMLAAAAAGLGVNVLVAGILVRGGRDSLNVRAALAHVLTDAVGSVGAMTAAGLILAFGWLRADAVVSMGIAALVAFSGWRVIRETTAILLEAAPGHIDVPAVERTIAACPGVCAVHDLHVWRISDRFDALTVHVTLDGNSHGVDVCRDVARTLRDTFGLEHVTVQPEAPPPAELVSLRASKEGRKLPLTR